MSGCLMPRFDGAILSQEWKEARRGKLVNGVPRSSQRGITGSEMLTSNSALNDDLCGAAVSRGSK